ncbi:MAG: zf-TFIIB domain-containing protein [Prochlorococcaceae cyanobacterium]|jgi:Zn-finger nucleic acid-binding protein
MKCACCAAPLPPRAVACAYCGSRQDVDLQSWVRAEAVGTLTQLSCPDCQQSLEAVPLGGEPPLEVGRCPRCLGLFLAHGVLEPLLSRTVRPSYTIDMPRLNELVEQAGAEAAGQPLRYRRCPVCGDVMNRSLYGKRSGVIVDGCRDHGLWLDAGELRQLMEWAHAGGQLYHQERRQEEEALEEKRRRREAEERRQGALELQSLEERRGFGGGADWLEEDLATLLARGLLKLLRG